MRGAARWHDRPRAPRRPHPQRRRQDANVQQRGQFRQPQGRCPILARRGAAARRARWDKLPAQLRVSARREGTHAAFPTHNPAGGCSLVPPRTLQKVAHLWMCSSPCVVQLASSGMLPNMLEEARRGVRVGFHVYLKAADEDVTPHLAAFLVVRAEGWLFFASTGWVDDDWRWQATAHTVPALATAVVHSSHVPCPVRALCGAGGRQSMTRWANAANRRVPLPACPRRSHTAASTRAARPCSTARARRARMQGTRIPSAARG